MSNAKTLHLYFSEELRVKGFRLGVKTCLWRKMNYVEMDVWKESMGLAEVIYTMTRAFLKEEVYGLTSQI